LTLFGEKVEKPEGYLSDWGAAPWLFRVDFERRSYFPLGDWKRLDDDN
jgi:hypothetical protein